MSAAHVRDALAVLVEPGAVVELPILGTRPRREHAEAAEGRIRALIASSGEPTATECWRRWTSEWRVETARCPWCGTSRTRRSPSEGWSKAPAWISDVAPALDPGRHLSRPERR